MDTEYIDCRITYHIDTMLKCTYEVSKNLGRYCPGYMGDSFIISDDDKDYVCETLVYQLAFYIVTGANYLNTFKEYDITHSNDEWFHQRYHAIHMCYNQIYRVYKAICDMFGLLHGDGMNGF